MLPNLAKRGIDMKRLKPDARKEQLLDAGLRLSVRVHYLKITKSFLSDEADCSMSLVNRHFGTMDAFRKALVAYAIKKEHTMVTFQALSCGNAHYDKLPRSLQVKISNGRYKRG